MNEQRLEVDNSTLEKLSHCQVAVAMERLIYLKPKDDNHYRLEGKEMNLAWEAQKTNE